jgi:hypothetical protein
MDFSVSAVPSFDFLPSPVALSDNGGKSIEERRKRPGVMCDCAVRGLGFWGGEGTGGGPRIRVCRCIHVYVCVCLHVHIDPGMSMCGVYKCM